MLRHMGDWIFLGVSFEYAKDTPRSDPKLVVPAPFNRRRWEFPSSGPLGVSPADNSSVWSEISLPSPQKIVLTLANYGAWNKIVWTLKNPYWLCNPKKLGLSLAIS